MGVNVHSDVVGPHPVGDIMTVSLRAAGGFVQVCYGDALTVGSADTNVDLGIGRVATSPAMRQALADGTAVDVSLAQLRPDFTVRDSGSQSGVFTWDPTSGLWRLIYLSGPGDARLTQILQAVVRNFPPNS